MDSENYYFDLHEKVYQKHVCQKRITKKVLIKEVDLILGATKKESSNHHLLEMKINPAMLAIHRVAPLGPLSHPRCRVSFHKQHVAAMHTDQSRGQSDFTESDPSLVLPTKMCILKCNPNRASMSLENKWPQVFQACHLTLNNQETPLGPAEWHIG